MNNRIEELRAASDAEVNLIVAKLAHPNAKRIRVSCCSNSAVVDGEHGGVGSYDYCIDWEVVGPLMIDNDINLNKVPFGGWCADRETDAIIQSVNINPLRAIAETYIIMKWSEE